MIRAGMLAIALVACGTPINATLTPDAAGFNSCNPGSPSTGGDCSGGTSACAGTCRHDWECSGLCQCDGIRCVAIPPTISPPQRGQT